MIRSTMVVAGLLAMALPASVAAVRADILRRPQAGAWTPYIEQFDRALAAGDTAGAERLLKEAHWLAFGSRRWEGYVAVGDARRRLAAVAADPAIEWTRARQAYLSGLLRAQALRSLEGVLRTAEGFAALGDREMVTQCLVVARNLAGNSEAGRALIEAAAAGLTERLATGVALGDGR